MSEATIVASGLGMAEGPVAMPDGSVLVVDVRGGRLNRVQPDGRLDVVAELGGGPNAAAIGPDGAAYVCNNGGLNWVQRDGDWFPVDHRAGPTTPEGYEGGWIERVDLATGAHELLYTECDGYRLRGPNDLVFDQHGGFWFTDFGKRRTHEMDIGGLFYALADGSHIHRAPGAVLTANGVGLSPDGRRVYVAETATGRVVAFDVDGPGQARPEATIVVATKDRFDSLAIEADGRIVVACLPNGLSIVSPDGSAIEKVPIDDRSTTNVCFGGADLRTAYVTAGGGGHLLAIEWPRPGLQLAYQVLPSA